MNTQPDNKHAPKPEDPKKKFNKVCTWLKKHTSKLDYGLKWKDHVIHCNRNREVVSYFFRQRNWLGGITREKFARHFNNEDTYYFAGGGEETSLVMLDIDCHEWGTLTGAKALAASLTHFFPNLYTEVSTNGNGMHGFFLVESNSKTNGELTRLAIALSTWLTFHPHDVQFIEVKGRAPAKTLENRRLVSYKAGTLAKVPREAVKRFDELLATTSLTLAGLSEVIEQLEADCKQPEIPEMPTEIISQPRPKKEKALCGSISGKHIDLEKLPFYEQFVEQLPDCQNVKTSDKHIVTTTDIAICIMILEHCSRNMNVDGSLPTARVWAMWDAMFKCGEIPRGWNAKRYSAIRNYLSSMGVIEWTDETYRMGLGSDKGKAAKWQFNDQFLDELAELGGKREVNRENNTSFIDTVIRLPSFIRPIETWIENEYRIRDLKLLEMTKELTLIFDQAA